MRAGCAVLLFSSLAAANGFEFIEQSPAGTAMAGAQCAKADDPAAVFYNPAGIALRDGSGVMAGVTVITGGFTARTPPPGAVNSSTARGVFVLPTAYASLHIGRHVAVGLGAFTQFGAGVRWNEKGQTVDPATGKVVEVPFPGRFSSLNTQLQSVTVNPVLAVRPHAHVALAAGLDVVAAATEFERALQLADVEGRARFGGSAVGVGFNVGVLVDVVPGRLSAGLSYRSAVELDFALKAHFTAPPELRDRVFDQPAASHLTLPHNVSFGVATFPTEKLTITTDLHWTLWSDVEELAVSFPSGKTPGLSSPMRWRDTWSVRVGGEYRFVLGARSRLALRLGAGWDPSPVPPDTLGPSAPVGDRGLVGGGLGIQVRGFGVDAGYLASVGGTRTSTSADLPATYGGALHQVSLALSYRWGPRR